eukprot:4293276-Alexandrium_andersonii.AAC.1
MPPGDCWGATWVARGPTAVGCPLPARPLRPPGCRRRTIAVRSRARGQHLIETDDRGCGRAAGPPGRAIANPPH